MYKGCTRVVPCLSGLLTKSDFGLYGAFGSDSSAWMPPLFIGGRYIQQCGGNIRTIDAIRGSEIEWSDKYGSGHHCCLETFQKWIGLGGLSPDSPAPPQNSARRAKYITRAFRVFLNREVALLGGLGLGGITLKMQTADQEILCEGYLWMSQRALKRIKNAVEAYHSRPMHMVTEIDTEAKQLQSTITSLLGFLQSSEAPEGAASPPVLEVLSGGLASANRLREGLAPYLAP